MVRGFVLGAPASGAGKTTLASALILALRRRGHRVQPFKVGPDYIDPSFLSLASGRPCGNLDGFLTPRRIPWILAEGSRGADLTVVEGVLGLYDGLGPEGLHSTARVARELALPVVLAVDASASATSVAALVHGFASLPGAPEVAGVLANRVSGPRHGDLVREALAQFSCPPLLGWVPPLEETLPSRHLGLVQAFERAATGEVLERVASVLEDSVDLEALVRLCREPRGAAVPPVFPEPVRTPDGSPLVLAVARDEAFSFLYRESLACLEALGATLAPFSPLRDEALPEGTRGVYLPGGYPEEHLDELAANEPLLAALRTAHASGASFYGECGGMMFLARTLTDRVGRTAPLAGLLDLEISFRKRLSRFGYVTCTAREDTLLFPAGASFPAHEFHYSHAQGEEPRAFDVLRASGGEGWREGYARPGLLAGYGHVNLLACPEAAARWLRASATAPGVCPLPSPRPRRRGRALMVCGTTSDAGKSFLVTGLCRLFARRGLKVAPFKAQNMALNATSVPGGGEIGTAQAVQAEACGIPPEVRHNPVLLKPLGDSRSQVILLGRPWKEAPAREYHRDLSGHAFRVAREALEGLLSENDLVVMEGAGSPAEMNLYPHDIVNLRAARAARAPVILAGDIERGGVLASLCGTLEVLPQEDRGLVAALVVNRFRGDPTLFDEGVRFLEERTRRPVLGVLPYDPSLRLPAEDSLNRKDLGEGPLRVAVVALPHLANFTDFDALGEEGCRVVFADRPSDLAGADLVVLPGTKTTFADLRWLRERGFGEAIEAAADRGTPVWGICGGYQMLGRVLRDPEGIEEVGEMPGLGLLPVETVFGEPKVADLAEGRMEAGAGWLGALRGGGVSGYEIHAGRTAPLGDLPEGAGFPLWTLKRGDKEIPDGAWAREGRVFGGYLHGAADHPFFRRGLLDFLRASKGLPPLEGPAPTGAELRLARYDRLADFLEAHLDMKRLEGLMEEGGR